MKGLFQVNSLKLQQAGLIRYARGRIKVLDHAGLEQRTCKCYAVVKKEYERLLPRVPALLIWINSPRPTRRYLERVKNN